MSKKNKYYIAYCFQEESTLFGYGNMVISNSDKLSIGDIEDIEILKEFIKKETLKEKNKNIYNIVIMDFRELKEEGKENE